MQIEIDIKNIKESISIINGILLKQAERIKKLENSISVTIGVLKEEVNQLLMSGEFYQKFREYLIGIVTEQVRVEIRNHKIMDDLRQVTAQTTKEIIVKTFNELMCLFEKYGSSPNQLIDDQDSRDQRIKLNINIRGLR